MNYTNQAVEAKREGKFDLAIEYYEKQLQEEGVTTEQLQAVAKIYYLKGQNLIAVMFNLAATHLSLYLDLQQYNSGDESIRGALEQLPNELKNQFPHPIGDALIHYSNLPRHIGHAYMDRDETYEKEPEFKNYAEIYYAQILGDGSQGAKFEEFNLTPADLLEIEDKRYKPVGYQVLLDHIKWDEIENPDVIALYMDQG